MHRRAQGLEAGERSSELDDTALGQLLTDPDHPVQATKYWVAGDDAYKGNASHSQSLLTPWPPQPEGIGTWTVEGRLQRLPVVVPRGGRGRLRRAGQAVGRAAEEPERLAATRHLDAGSPRPPSCTTSA
jgi:hypothetical protein